MPILPRRLLFELASRALPIAGRVRVRASTRLELTSSLYPAHLWSAWQCMENCTCAKDKCFCVDKDQKPWPLVGTEFEKQLTQGHIGNSGKKAHCACSCDKEGLG